MNLSHSQKQIYLQNVAVTEWEKYVNGIFKALINTAKYFSHVNCPAIYLHHM